MRYSAKLLGLVVATAALVPFAQMPRVFGEEWRLLQPAMAQGESVAARQAEADRLLQQGIEQFNVSQFREALQSWEQALAIYREIGDRGGEGGALGNLGVAYDSLGQYPQAIDYYEQRLAIAREIGNLRGEGIALGNLGNVYYNLGQYPQSIDYSEQSLAIARKVGDRDGEGTALGNLGVVYRSLGQYPQAIDYSGRSLAIAREIGDRAGEGSALVNLGVVYLSLGQYPQAIDSYEQSLAIVREIGDRDGEGFALGNLCAVYLSLGQYPQAIDYSEQSLAIAREIGDRDGEGRTLVNLGNAYLRVGQHPQAIDSYEQSLAIAREIGDRAVEGKVLGNLGSLFAKQDQPELAIIFLKASVQVREAIRGDISSLDTALQQSYTDTVAGTYRRLADLLLQQGRIPEAQQVLDLLKIEELSEFAHTTRATWTGRDLAYTDPEQAVITAHGSLIALGGQLTTCETTNCAQLETLYSQLEALKRQYEDQVTEFEATIRANRADDEIFQTPGNISGEAEALLAAYAEDGQKAVLIYPFVLEDKLWLVWATAGNVVGSVEVPVPQGELSIAVQRFGELLQNPQAGSLADLQATSQQLYSWIIEPLDAELAKNDIDHLIFVNDRVTRYIPMAALFDGERFLLERYRISTVLAPGLTDTTARLAPVEATNVLGLGLSQAVANFDALPGVVKELSGIVRDAAKGYSGIYPGQVLLDNEFTLETLQTNVANHQVLHVATHAAFVPGRAEESFIVLGNGERLTITDIEVMERRLRDLHLVVLSACQTALGGEAGDGTEIAGISSYFLEAGRAETVIASLWKVNDDSTSLLMQRFYELLATGELTKAEALRQAQLSLLYDEDTETRLAASRATIQVESRDGSPLSAIGFQHPYHWAPFILIGNGL